MVKKNEAIRKDHLRDGDGYVLMYPILSTEELMGHGTLYARVVIPPHCGIGWHVHNGNTEPYYVIKGEGIFTDKDGEHRVTAGDICTIPCGEGHAMRNDSEEDMEMIALIINEG
ncbi:MAG: cupin domain-containing protein [Lachnospiraceae bacterium]|nr:cupin domain-containing protein [Lachnospiraceae bacterium]